MEVLLLLRGDASSSYTGMAAPELIVMFNPRIFLLLLFLSSGLMSLSVRAEEQNMESLLQLDIDQLMQLRVVTASRHEQESWQAPAVITVLLGENLRRQGYRSLSEALARVPGIHVIQDGVGSHVVVRGVGSGQRAYARTLKLMLDGQPLGLRSDASQFLGPELIPLGVVERIEIVRGPASALYGADAYLGVINIITRRDAPSVRVQLGLGQEESAEHGASLELLASQGKGAWTALVTGAIAREDRSGRELPASSPHYNNFADPESREDINRPGNLYARLQHERESLRHTLAMHMSELDSTAEFLDFGTLSHDNRVNLRQQTLSWNSEWQASTEQNYQLRLAHAWGGPTDSEHLSLGQTGSHPEREFGYRAWDLGLEGQYAWTGHHVVGGLDGSWNSEEAFDVFSVNDSTGSRTQLSATQPDHLFRNLGAYLQYQWQPTEKQWALAMNWRHDSHNQYGDHDSYRVGLTSQLLPRLHGKLLYGTAFKAPNAFQLYAQPLYTGGILGNPGLEPETTKTLEGQLSWEAKANLLVTVTAYQMQVNKLIELQPFGLNQRWSNRGREDGHGLESELRWQQDHHQLGLSTAWHDTTVRLEQPLIPLAEVETASAPRLLARLDWRYVLPVAELGVEGRYVSERRASDSNIDINLRQVYTLPAYTIWRLNGFRQLGAHRVGLVLDNALDKRYAEPGYEGVDFPGQRRSLWLNWSWQH